MKTLHQCEKCLCPRRRGKCKSSSVRPARRWGSAGWMPSITKREAAASDANRRRLQESTDPTKTPQEAAQALPGRSEDEARSTSSS